eukprot:TRINITY_DN1216_c0_g1_i19.p2 TRINITY_DN1216_c0_g1~~TRINITY_DN1216_c0_g1_i19.p2  ORF type:complete len:167 (-),score=24.03 TRINITY_DN1216_c0_g1_i19:1368-1868(-)
MGKPGCHPPSFLLPPDWRDRLQPMWEMNEGIEVLVQHRLPDIILANAIAGAKITVVIADAAVCWSNIDEAAERKLRAYEPLAELIRTHLGVKCKSVKVVPIVFTARGTPPPNWAEICSDMHFRVSGGNLCNRIQKEMLLWLHRIFGAWRQAYLATGLADGGERQNS